MPPEDERTVESLKDHGLAAIRIIRSKLVVYRLPTDPKIRPPGPFNYLAPNALDENVNKRSHFKNKTKDVTTEWRIQRPEV